MKINYVQNTDSVTGITSLLNKTEGDVKKSLIKVMNDGTRTVVPTCDHDMYPFLLDKEIESARTVIKKPNFGKVILSTVGGWILIAAFVGDWIGLSGSDYFVAYFIILVLSVAEYAMSVYNRNKQVSNLSAIRSLLMEDYINQKFVIKDLSNTNSEGIVVSLREVQEPIRSQDGTPVDIEMPEGRVTPNPFN